MENLWKKKHDQTSYINLFTSIEKSECNESKLNYFSSYKSSKNNQHSTDLRMSGNVKFRQGLWLEAIKFYNHSLCFAETGTENVALAYAIRSESFFHLKMFAESIIDIELAKNANIPIRFLEKLEERKEKCKHFMSLDEKSPENIVKLSYEPHEHFPCLANVVELKQSTEFGRHLIAKCDIPVGQTLLIEKDFLSLKTDNEIVCNTCFRENTNFIPCAQCPDVVFCNTECINQNSVHKWECGSFSAQLHYRMKFEMKAVLLAIETFSTIESLMEFIENVLLEDPENIPTSLYDANSKYHFFFKLSACAPFQPKDIYKVYQIYSNIMAMPKVAVLFDSDVKQCFLMHLVLHHFLIIKTNSVICKSPWSTISTFNILSMLNHSCAPNLYHPRKGRQQYCFTIRPVSKGEQLYISYLPLNSELSFEQRQQKFKSSWNFICKCEKCDPVNKPIEPDIIIADPYYTFLLENYKIDGNKKNLKVLMNNSIKFLNKYGQSQWSTEILTISTIFVMLYIEMFLESV